MNAFIAKPIFSNERTMKSNYNRSKATFEKRLANQMILILIRKTSTNFTLVDKTFVIHYPKGISEDSTPQLKTLKLP